MTGTFEYFDRAAVLLVFFILHLLVGAVLSFKDRRLFLFALVEQAGGEINRRLNRPGRTPSDLFMRGVFTVAMMGTLAYFIGAAADRLARYPYGWLAWLLFLALCLSVMSPLKRLQEMLKALNAKNTAKAAALLKPYYREDLSKADSHTCIRRALELSAVQMMQYLVAPSIFFVLFGARGLALYVTVAALFDAFGTTDLRHLNFSRPVRWLEKILNAAPALLTGLLIIVASFIVSRSNPFRAIKVSLTQASKLRDTHRGFVIAALAGGLGVTLAGPVRDAEDHVIYNGWVGAEESSAKVTPQDLQRGTMLHFIVFILMIILTSGFYVLYRSHNLLFHS